ncbi:BgTH12-03188 [Blumeria graminis f. sp. triticale]|uniref:Bgt-1409 n=3 Tax=Blumeria graminis TaxID=34373 RepID=A0A9X9MIX7_BLUGR|nr:hypothetical protein BGT96224_1409 [Blumeria graminis f. sp. tritici 96224]CAD6503526.1 BgTH12-03188 [Blumeria graminis f. sp. triticale]VDB89652.1 Bgt-1409 [Blumeria graminis f. sp. tritici]
MLTLRKAKGHEGKCTPNVLPCRINFSGPVGVSKRHWHPIKKSDGNSVVYFRGKKLYGKRIHIPKNYRGVVLSKSDQDLPETMPTEENIEEEANHSMSTECLEEKQEFEDIVVWGHETLPDESSDPYLRGINDWIALTKLIHAHENEDYVPGDEKLH